MKKSRIPIPDNDRAKILLWCARHCCFCGKACTTNIEVHHIDGDPANNDLENLIPVCFDCHGELERYNPKHPVGTKYRSLEITTRRDQIYELYTRGYLRQLEITISRYFLSGRDQHGKLVERRWGDTSCSVRTLSQDIPVRLKLCVKPYQNGIPITADFGDLYTGEDEWNLNPNFIVHGHFELPISGESQPFDFRLEFSWSVIDSINRKHDMLPFSYVWNDPTEDWWYDPRILHV